jgi:hypothetical protein
MVNDPASDGWHIDRRVPLVLVISIAVTFATNLALGVWFTADIYHNVQANRDRLNSMVLQIKELDDRSDTLKEGLIQLKADVKHGTDETGKVRILLEEFLKEQRSIQREENRRLRNGNGHPSQ